MYGGVAYIGLNKDVRTAAGVDAGDRVRVRMELDTELRTVEVPDDLRSALTEDPAAQAAFDKLRSPIGASTSSGSRRPGAPRREHDASRRPSRARVQGQHR